MSAATSRRSIALIAFWYGLTATTSIVSPEILAQAHQIAGGFEPFAPRLGQRLSEHERHDHVVGTA